MHDYIDIRLLPDAEIPASVLVNAVYTKLHKALCDLGSTGIGVSFPNFKLNLGSNIRLHGAASDLSALQSKDWLGGMAGYCQVSDIRPVPDKVQYRTVSRKQPNMSQSKLRRLIKRGSITEKEAKDYKNTMFSKGLEEAYIEMKSSSNGHKHRRYIQFGKLVDTPVSGEFDQFGLSKTATVPWF